MLLWSTAVHHLRVSEEVFWRLTPAQYSALSRRWDEQRELDDTRLAQIMCLMANVHRGKRRPFKLQNFLPSKKRDSSKPKDQKTLHAMWRAIVAPRMGNEKKPEGQLNG